MAKLVLITGVILLCLFAASNGHRTQTSGSPRPTLPPAVTDLPVLPSDIVGGERTAIVTHKHQVAIISRAEHVLGCGGSIIDRDWILTAAHCCVGKRKSDLSLRVGSSYYRTGGDLYYVASIIYHASYDEETTDYDVCLMKTTKPIVFGKRVQAIPMVNEGTRHNAGTLATITGWGKQIDSVDAQSSIGLRGAQIPILSPAQCKERYAVKSQDHFITDRQICAGARTGGIDTCQGDSGGPLVIDNQLVGVTSWGIGCGDRNFPGVYANVAAFRPWIRRHAGVEQ